MTKPTVEGPRKKRGRPRKYRLATLAEITRFFNSMRYHRACAPCEVEEFVRLLTAEDAKMAAEPCEVEFVRFLTAEDIASLRAWRRRPRGGRPADHALNQELLEVANDAQRRGTTLQASIRSWIRRKGNRMPNPKEVLSWQRRICRLREAQSSKPVASATEPIFN